MKLALDGDDVKTFDVEGRRTLAIYEQRFTAKEGDQRIAISFINDFYDEERGRDRNLFVHSVEVEGPFGLGDNLPETHRRIVAVKPNGNRTADDAARENLKPLLKRAFRRPVNDAEVAQYAKFAQLAVGRGESFERGMQVALQAILVSPHFLFRVEDDSRKDSQGRQTLSDYELASRLSYFLWSSMPDDELFRLAEQKKLRDDKTLEQQVRRMLADEKAGELIENFAGQWLGLRKLATNEVEPDNELFPEFNDQIRRDMWEETERFFGHVVREDRSVLDLINGRYTFVNERLAKFYGLEGVEGNEFRRVEFDQQPRAGIVTHPSILTLTSYPDRTSPVKRGEWVLANLLGDAPPDPPPLVPALEETSKANPDLPMRKQLELHREDPGCASCHVVMDEIGFGLENFDAIGRWREKIGKHPVDAVGTLPSGERFEGPVELVQILMQRKDDFARCLTEKLLTYALGRGLEYYDRCAVDEITGRLKENDYRFSALVTGIVQSEPFRLRGNDE
jgi:hypothetical protein